jgi:hypothetical protein
MGRFSQVHRLPSCSSLAEAIEARQATFNGSQGAAVRKAVAATKVQRRCGVKRIIALMSGPTTFTKGASMDSLAALTPSSVGMTAAKGLATRLQSEGVSVNIIAPARGTDWLDRLNAIRAA